MHVENIGDSSKYVWKRVVLCKNWTHLNFLSWNLCIYDSHLSRFYNGTITGKSYIRIFRPGVLIVLALLGKF